MAHDLVIRDGMIVDGTGSEPYQGDISIDGDAITEIRPYFTGTQERLVPQRPADLSQFSPEEIEIADNVVDEFWQYSARRISEYSHQEWAWISTSDFEEIQYYRAWVSSEMLTPEQIEEGQRIAKEQAPDYAV